MNSLASAQKVLVVGGAGYIGSHCVLDLKRKGYEPWILDNFSNGNRDIAAKLQVPLIEGDINNPQDCRSALQQSGASVVMHFAAHAYVGESVLEPARYYSNNVIGTFHLLEAMRELHVSTFIFSSTCATYGIPETIPITESTPQNPVNPYGRTKLAVEWILRDFALAYGLRFVAFRYFNAAGADTSGIIGERHDPETHLIPLAIEAAESGKPIKVFGADYDTPDGTCIRDYIHVNDISAAHILGIEYLAKGGESTFLNIGNGKGYSVLEVLSSVERVSGKRVPREVSGRRAGDPPRLVADYSMIESVLGWKPAYPELDAIVESAWRWHKSDRS